MEYKLGRKMEYRIYIMRSIMEYNLGRKKRSLVNWHCYSQIVVYVLWDKRQISNYVSVIENQGSLAREKQDIGEDT